MILQLNFPTTKEADGWNTSEYLPGSNTPLQWKCEKGHQWTISPNKERVKGQVVLFGNKKLEAGVNDLLSFLTLDLRRKGGTPVLFFMEREKFVTGNARKDIPGAHLFRSARVSAQVARIAVINSSGKDSTICNQCSLNLLLKQMAGTRRRNLRVATKECNGYVARA